MEQSADYKQGFAAGRQAGYDLGFQQGQAKARKDAEGAKAMEEIKKLQAEDSALSPDEKFRLNARRQWEGSPELQREFAMGGFESYLAFERNKANVRVQGEK